MLYSEMIVTGALVYGDRESFLEHTEDSPCAVQLGGSNPKDLATSAKMVEQAGYQEVNLNCGCPSDRVQQGGIGACLMAEPDLVADCFEAMATAVSIPVTIKTRIGIDDQDDYGFFQSFISKVYDRGCREFHIHARKAILSGLSPKENREIPPLRYEYVSRIQQDFPGATFILNGGIKTADQALALLEQYPGVMMGRAPYNDPWILAELEHRLFGKPIPDRFDILNQYRVYIEQEMDRGIYLKHMTKHLFGLFLGMPGARAFRRHLSTHMNKADATIAVLDDAVSFVRSAATESIQGT